MGRLRVALNVRPVVYARMHMTRWGGWGQSNIRELRAFPGNCPPPCGRAFSVDPPPPFDILLTVIDDDGTVYADTDLGPSVS